MIHDSNTFDAAVQNYSNLKFAIAVTTEVCIYGSVHKIVWIV